jgi:LysM repeat protein
MKSSTIRRSNLSKEKIAVLEALSKFKNSNDSNSDIISDSAINNEPMDDASPEVYVRQNKEKELDILWKDFKMPKGERSPIVYLGMGFFAGVITTLLVSAFIGMSSGNFHPNFSFGKSAETTEAVAVPAEASASAETAAQTGEVAAEANTAEAEAKPAKKVGLFGVKNNAETATETSSAPEMKEYVVQDGDTMDRIVRNFYGSYSEENVNAVMKANNMTNPNKLSIGQKLVIPVSGTTSAE